MTLRLRPLRDDELPAYIEQGRAAYARDLESQAGATAEGAAIKAEADWSRLFPDGVVSSGNELLALEDVESGERVGDIWLAERENDFGERTAFLYNIQILPEVRGQGFGRQAMELFEGEARSRGLAQANLMVFGGNDVARSLYRKLGYAERAVFMSRDL